MDWFSDPVRNTFYVCILAAFIGILIYFLTKKKDILSVLLSGFADPRFKNVEDVFRKTFENGVEKGAAFAVYYKGKLVVDLWGGYVNQEGQIPWRESTMSPTFSSSKGITALLVAKFVELGYLDYKQLVSHYWPEFGKNGKEAITVEMLLSHQAGLIGFDEPISITLLKTDFNLYVSLLEDQKPFWEPGTEFGYHILSWGYYVDVLLMKADPKKRTVDKIFQEEIAEPFGIDFFQGTPTSEQYRITPRLYTQSFWHQIYLLKDKDFWKRLKFAISDEHGYQKTAESASLDYVDKNAVEASTDYELRTIPLSSFNGFGTARGIAKLYGIISDGGVYEKKTLLTETTLDTLEQVLVKKRDAVLGTEMAMGRGLMIIDSPTGSTMIGHPGFGGQMGICDRQNNLGISYLKNNLSVFEAIGQSYTKLTEAVYESLKQIQDG